MNRGDLPAITSLLAPVSELKSWRAGTPVEVSLEVVLLFGPSYYKLLLLVVLPYNYYDLLKSSVYWSCGVVPVLCYY